MLGYQWAYPDYPLGLPMSSRGVELHRFYSHAHREVVRAFSPLVFEGTSLSFERPEETSNYFFHVPTWLALITVIDFPTRASYS